MTQFNESVGETGPKFTGYWKAKDSAPPGKKMVGGESVNNEEANPTDKVTMDIPLFLRVMEYAKEDAKTDMDLHNVTERAIELMKQNEHLNMDNYNDLVGGQPTGVEQPTSEAKREFFAADQSPAMMKAREMAKEHGVKVQWVLQFIRNGTYIEGKKANNNVGARNRAVANLEKDWDKFSKLYKDFTPNTDAYMNATNEEKKGLYYYVNKRKKAGTSRPKGHPKAPSEQDWKNAAKTAKKESVEEAGQFSYGKPPRKGTVAHNAAMKRKEDEKKTKPIEPKDQMVGVAKVTKESKIKGADGKACWDGYRYAGTKNGKDICKPIKKGK